MRTRLLCFVVAALIGLLCAGSKSQAGTINVTSLNDSGTGTLRQAINSANPGDTIQVTVLGTITLTSGGLVIDKSLNIYGVYRTTPIVRGAGSPDFRIFTINAGTVDMRFVTISNGKCASNEFGGGGVYVTGSSNIFLAYSTVSGNDANGNSGGGVFNNGATVFLFDCTLTDNQALIGGAVHNNGGTLEMDNSTVVNNAASTSSTSTGGGGGFFNFNGQMTIRDSTITGNSAKTNSSSGGGGGIRNFSGTLTVGNSIISGNTSNQLGPDVLGLVTSEGYNLVRIKDDSAGLGNPGDQLGTAAAPRNPDLGPLRDNGGPVDTRAPNDGSPVIDQGKALGAQNDGRARSRPYDNPNIANAPGGDGADIGALEVQAPLVVTNTNDSGPGSLREAVTKPKVVSGDTVTFAPNVTGTINLTSGELLPQESITIKGPGQTVLTIARSSVAGTANFRIFDIAQNVTAVISGLAISNGNLPSGESGGGIANYGTLIVRDCTIQDNFATGGAGILNLGTITVTRCSFARNDATGSRGGGLANVLPPSGTATATITGSTFFDNVAGDGGGVYNESTLSLTNCTISGNMANPTGGGIDNIQGAMTLLNCTVSNNTGTSMLGGTGGGGIANQSGSGGTVHLGNTIVASNSHNQGGRDLFGAFISDGYNLIRVKEDSTGFTDGVNHDLVGTAASPRNAGLGQLQLYGGTVPTVPIGSNSPAINAGNDATAPNRDQRGFVRNGTSDIGAYELNGTIPVRLANISTRALVQTGDNVLIGGFIVTGTFQKRVLLRGIGPSLTVPGKLENPILELYDDAGHLVIGNDNWMDAPNKQEIIDTTIPPASTAESAILMNLNPGNYTAILTGANDSSGIGVVEAYDLDNLMNAQLANISTRCLVQTGDNVLIGGFIVVGPDSQKVIVRAIGPSLSFPGTLADPTLELHDTNGALLDSNDNWNDYPNKQAILDSTIPPTNDLESAIVRTLPPANYTAIVRGVNNTIGIAVVEVYALQ